MIGPDRRTFIRTAAGIAVAASPMKADSLPPPMPGKADEGLKPSTGDGMLPTPNGAIRRLGDVKMRIPGHINALQFSPKGTTLISATSGELRGWDPKTGKVLFRLAYPSEATVDSGRLTSRDTFALVVRPNSGANYELRHYAFGTGKLLSRSSSLKIENTQHIAFSVDGTRVAAVHNESFCCFDGATGEEKWKVPIPAEAVGDCKFFSDGSAVALASKGEIKVFASATGKQSGTLKVGTVDGKAKEGGTRGRDFISDLMISADGKWVAASVGDDADEVYCWDVASASVKHRLKPAGKPIGFNPNGAELVTTHLGKAIFWALTTGKVVREFDVPRDDLVLSPDGKMLAASAADSAILIDAANGNRLNYSAEPPGVPTSLRFAANGKLVGRLDNWGGWIEWDSKTGLAAILRPPGVSGLVPVDLSADAKVGLYRKEGDYSTRDMSTGKQLFTTKGNDNVNDSVTTVAITPDGGKLVALSADGLTVTTDKGPTVIRQTGESPGTITTIATDGRLAAVAFKGNDHRGFIDLYDLAEAKYVRRLTTDGHPRVLSLSVDGTRLLVAYDIENGRGRQFGQEQHGSASVFDLRKNKEVFRTANDDNYREHVSTLSPDGRVLARLGDKGRVHLWDVHAREMRATIEIEESASVNALAISPDGRTLAASVNGGPVFLWDLYARDAMLFNWLNVDRAWASLRDGNATTAFVAIKLLVREGHRSIPMLREKVAPIEPPDPKVVAQHITDLDHKDFRKREGAARALADLGERAREPLRQSLSTGPSPEMRERIERLLAAEDWLTPDQKRRLRAIEVAEVIGTPQAVQVLAHWGTGAPGAMFTMEAMAARKRIEDRK